MVAAARRALPSAEDERPSSLRRRRTALALLVELRPSDESWPILKPLMDHTDPVLATGAARIAVTLGTREDRMTAVDRLLNVLPAADWFLRSEIQDCLSSLYAEARSRIEAEIAERSALPRAQQITDSVLATMLAVRRRNQPEGST